MKKIISALLLSIAIQTTLPLFASTEMSNLSPEGLPTIGSKSSNVHVVVFEEPKCTNCKLYSSLIFPLIKKNYIDTNKIKYTLIPVSFIPGSMPAAEAWLCVYHQDKTPNETLLFSYVDYTFANQPSEDSDWATYDTLANYAKKTDPSIRLDLLKQCLSSSNYQKIIEKNTDYGMKLMNGNLDTPTILVNGKKIDQITFEKISKAIDEALNKK